MILLDIGEVKRQDQRVHWMSPDKIFKCVKTGKPRSVRLLRQLLKMPEKPSESGEGLNS